MERGDGRQSAFQVPESFWGNVDSLRVTLEQECHAYEPYLPRIFLRRVIQEGLLRTQTESTTLVTKKATNQELTGKVGQFLVMRDASLRNQAQNLLSSDPNLAKEKAVGHLLRQVSHTRDQLVSPEKAYATENLLQEFFLSPEDLNNASCFYLSTGIALATLQNFSELKERIAGYLLTERWAQVDWGVLKENPQFYLLGLAVLSLNDSHFLMVLIDSRLEQYTQTQDPEIERGILILPLQLTGMVRALFDEASILQIPEDDLQNIIRKSLGSWGWIDLQVVQQPLDETDFEMLAELSLGEEEYSEEKLRQSPSYQLMLAYFHSDFSTEEPGKSVIPKQMFDYYWDLIEADEEDDEELARMDSAIVVRLANNQARTTNYDLIKKVADFIFPFFMGWGKRVLQKENILLNDDQKVRFVSDLVFNSVNCAREIVVECQNTF